MRGFKKDNVNETGFLSICSSASKGSDVYNVVEDIEEAARFPSKNIYNVEGFGTPIQWLEFFKGEHGLSSWKFHLLKVDK